MNFGEALEQVKHGIAMHLPHWEKDVRVKAQFPDEHSKMTTPYLYVESRFGLVPWKETMIELFSEEWEAWEWEAWELHRDLIPKRNTKQRRFNYGEKEEY